MPSNTTSTGRSPVVTLRPSRRFVGTKTKLSKSTTGRSPKTNQDMERNISANYGLAISSETIF